VAQSGFIPVIRLVPELPPSERALRLVIDSDVANGIGDLCAISLAIASPDRFRIEGIVSTHFNNQAVVRAPHMNEYRYFEPARAMGKMLRVFDSDNDRVWSLLFQRMAAFPGRQ